MKKIQILLIIILTLPVLVFAKKEFTRNIEHSWNINSKTSVFLSNEYGKFDIRTWDKDIVDINIVITVKASSREAAKDVFDRISFDFAENSNSVSAETILDKKKKSFFDIIFGQNTDDYSIDWIVYMPKSNELNIENKYGSTYLEDMDGSLDFDLKYGDLKMGSANDKLELVIGYGDAKIEYINSGNIYVKYGELKIDSANELFLETKYSDINIGVVQSLDHESKYDDIEIDAVEKLDIGTKYGDLDVGDATFAIIDSKYTDVSINKLRVKAEVNTEYGEFSIKSVEKGFESIFVDGKYTDISIITGDGVDYIGNFKTKYADLDFRRDFTFTSTIKELNSNSIEGYSGSKQSDSVIEVYSGYGDIIIK